MLGQAECTKPADHQLIQIGTNDEWHFKQSVRVANSSCFPGVPSCSMLLLLLMKCCAAYSLYQAILPLFILINMLAMTSFTLSIIYKVQSIFHMSWYVSAGSSYPCRGEQNLQHQLQRFIDSNNNVSFQLWEQFWFKFSYPDVFTLFLGWKLGWNFCSNGWTSWENLSGESDDKKSLLLEKLLMRSNPQIPSQQSLRVGK